MIGTTRRAVAAPVVLPVVLLVVLLVVALLGGCSSGASSAPVTGSAATVAASSGAPDAPVDPVSGLSWIAESALPPQARDLLGVIDAGGPYRYPGKDGSTFGNFEGLLPREQRGYYREYTVDTPGSEDRGARRIVTGDGGEYYYTQDHYESFSRIRR